MSDQTNIINCYVAVLTLNSRRINKDTVCSMVEKQSINDKEVNLNYDDYKESTGISFSECIMQTIPSSSYILEKIPNLVVISIIDSKFSKITSEDLIGYDCLRELYIEDCEVESIPGDLLKHTPNLEFLSFFSNKIKFIDQNIIPSLRQLKYLNLMNNVNIDALFDSVNNTGDVNLKQMIEKSNCSVISLVFIRTSKWLDLKLKT